MDSLKLLAPEREFTGPVESFVNGKMSQVFVILDQNKNTWNFKYPRPGRGLDFINEGRKLEFLKSKGIGLRFLGLRRKPSLVMITEHIMGSPLGNRKNLEGVNPSRAVEEMKRMYAITPRDFTWGKMKDKDYSSAEKSSLNDYLEKEFITKISDNGIFTKEEVHAIVAKIRSLISSENQNKDKKQPVLIHGDANPWNIIVNSGGEAQWIDYGAAKYSLPEEDFATMFAFPEGKDIAHQLKMRYEKETGGKFDTNLIRLFILCFIGRRLSVASRKLREREKSMKELALSIVNGTDNIFNDNP